MNSDATIEHELRRIHARLRACRKCPNVCDRAVHGPPVVSPVMIVGQAPGVHEGRLGRPFAFTAGKTLFKWLHGATGAREEVLRELVYFSAVARCFPGKAVTGVGDRPPSFLEIANCREHLAAEVQALRPKLVLAVGRSAIADALAGEPQLKNFTLNDVVGKKFSVRYHGVNAQVVPLPHPSGVSRWPQTEPGKTKLAQALKIVGTEFRRLQL